jgi:SAM-dependent methyltransferase
LSTLPNNKRSTPITHCLCCGGVSLAPYLDLGNQPPCNWLHDGSAEQQPPFFPLETVVCTYCFHSQLTVAVDPAILFSNYTYRTGVSRTLVEHYKTLAEYVAQKFQEIHGRQPSGMSYGDKVVDIGCNDGTLLKHLGNVGFTRVGVDPCGVPEIKENSDLFFESAWNEGLVRHSKDYNYVRPLVITATNVLAHNDNPKQFINLIYQDLPHDGFAVIEFPYAKDLLKHCEFDTIYHEHISYFNVNSFRHLLQGTGLYIAEIQEMLVHGGSLRIMLRRCEKWAEEGLHSESVWDLVEAEKNGGLLNHETYNAFQDRVNKLTNWLNVNIESSREEGRAVIGFGASGKSTVILNYGGIHLDCIVDETPSKVGKLSPGMNIPIVPLEYLRQYVGYLDIVVMAWNCWSECCQKIKQSVNAVTTVRVIRYIPHLEIVQLEGIPDLSSGNSLEASECKMPPEGWRCTREAGHEGPCAALPIRKV